MRITLYTSCLPETSFKNLGPGNAVAAGREPPSEKMNIKMRGLPIHSYDVIGFGEVVPHQKSLHWSALQSGHDGLLVFLLFILNQAGQPGAGIQSVIAHVRPLVDG